MTRGAAVGVPAHRVGSRCSGNSLVNIYGLGAREPR
jgi:hypothetical protein